MKQQYLLDEIDQIAAAVITNSEHRILLFYGEMGVGKTTLIKHIVKELGVNDTVSSPTFSLINEYRTSTGEPVYHFDFYRIEKEEEAMDIGIEEYFDSGHWCFIEWPDKVENLLPLKLVNINITLDQNLLRTIELTNHE
jgi:tRNA threonylcarbamoyladenosine biosynthesis protein TsaE